MNIEERKYWDKNGYIILKDILTNEECNLIKKIIIELAEWERNKGSAHIYDHDPSYTAGYTPESQQTGNLQRVWNLINKHEIFRKIIQHPLILEIMNELFDRDTSHHKFTLNSFQANIIGSGGAEQKLHVDTPIPEPFPSWIMQANTIWLIDDFTKDNGATWCLPGSHKFGIKPSEKDQSRKDLIQMEGKKGSVIITHGFLWHKSGKNKTQNSRIGLLGAFAASYFRDISNEEEYLVVVDNDILESASETLKKLIGVGHGVHKGALEKSPFSKKKIVSE